MTFPGSGELKRHEGTTKERNSLSAKSVKKHKITLNGRYFTKGLTQERRRSSAPNVTILLFVT